MSARLSRPRLPRAFVVRQRLLDLMDAGAQRPVTLICAGAGCGKTLLAASWAATAGPTSGPPGPVAWLALDAEDNNPGVFWTDVLAALRGTGAVPEGTVLASLGSGPSVDKAFIERTVQGLGQLSGPVVLVIDDLHLIDEPQIMRDLAILLRSPPERLRLVLIGRSDSALPLHRLRAAGELTEIRTRDLEFTPDEATRLLAQHGLRLTGPQLALLLGRTEGWAAGLRLAATFLTAPGERRRVEDFAGDVHAVADYLASEVLATQPPEVRRFLLYTSIADQLCGELADAITGGGQGQRTLEQLERANAFVVGLGPQPRWFRYHHLLGDLLAHQLRLEAPEMVRELHLRAARWHQSQNAPVNALNHAVAAEDWPYVGRLVVAAAGPLILTTDRAALLRVLERVPPEEFDGTAELTVCAALLLFHAHGYDAVPERMAQARALLDGRDVADRRPVEITLRLVELGLARVHGDMQALIAAATDVLGWLTDAPLAQLPSALQYRAIALNNKGVGLLWSGQFEAADRYLMAAVTAARTARVELVEINVGGHLALLHMLRGRLREAADHAANVRDLAERRGWSSTPQVVPALVTVALVELERHNLAAAQAAVEQAFAAHYTDGEAAQYVALRMTQARVLLARGDAGPARAVFEQTPVPADLSAAAPALRRFVSLTGAELDLASGYAERARARIDLRPDRAPLTDQERIHLARAEVALGDPTRADTLLAPLRATSDDRLSTVEAWIVTALVADALRQGNRSVDALVRALAVAEPEGIRGPFLRLGRTRLAALMARQRWLVPQHSAFVDALVEQLRPDQTGAEPLSSTGRLSERELEVLRYLPTMFNAGEIADELYVSVNTVKAHLRAIYSKLGVSRRREAVVRARELGIL